MPYEDSYQDSPLEKKKKELEEERQVLLDAREKAKEIASREITKKSEYYEIDVIRNGLKKKLQELIEEDKRLSATPPETDEEYDVAIARMQRINSIHLMMADLYDDLDKVSISLEALEAEFQILVEQTKL